MLLESAYVADDPLAALIEIRNEMLTRNVQATADLRMLLEQAGQVNRADAGMVGRVLVRLDLLRVGCVIEQDREAGVPCSERLVPADETPAARSPRP